MSYGRSQGTRFRGLRKSAVIRANIISPAVPGSGAAVETEGGVTGAVANVTFKLSMAYG